MNWKPVLTSVIAVIIALVVWEMFVKNLVLRNQYEAFDYKPGENEGYLRRVA